MLEFQIIESSSAGNCALLCCEGARILIDAGVGIRKTEKFLQARGMTFEDLSAVFVTHEHGDHCKALQCLDKYPHIKIFANRPTASYIKSAYPRTKALEWRAFTTGDIFDFCGVRVNPFSIPHDTSDAVGYCFKTGGKSIVWMTDIGKITHLAERVALEANILVLESNYCPKMLEDSDRPHELKKRIRGGSGHLSNDAALELIKRLNAEVVEKIFLAHVSRECNSVKRIAEMLDDLEEPLRARIEIVSPFEASSRNYRCE